jgi:hypothetical protein
LYLLRRRFLQAGLHAVLAPLLATAVYGTVSACGIRPVVFTDALMQRGTLLEPLVWLKALVAWGQTVCSGNFLFSIPAAAEKLIRLLPFKMLQEELFMGRLASPLIPLVASVTFVLAAGLAAGVFCLLMRHIKQVLTNRSAASSAVFVWFAGAAAMAFCFESANPEMWICSLPPLWLLAGLAWNAVPEGRFLRWLPATLAAALLLHNWAGGMSLVKSPTGDYCRQKAAWIIEQARPGDLILTADAHSFVTFLQYQTPARVVDGKFITPAQWNDLRYSTPGRIFIFSDAVEPLPPVARRVPESVRKIQEVSAQLQTGLRPVHSDPFGTVYQWQQPAAPPAEPGFSE